MKEIKVLQVGSYPPPHTGWSVRIKYLKEALIKEGYECQVLNMGSNRRIKSCEYIDVQNGLDYWKKLIKLRLKKYQFHIHINAQSSKGPILSLVALLISFVTFKRPVLTFHGGLQQLYFPRHNANSIMYMFIYTLFLISKAIICNNEPIKDKIVKYGPLIKEDKTYPIPAFSVQYMKFKKVVLKDEIDTFIKSKKHIILCYIVLRNGFFIETLLEFLSNIDSNIGLILTGIREVEDDEVSIFYKQILELEKENTILTVYNLNHDEYMTLLGKSHIYLRTPVSDGVSSSVLEALSLKVPVIASENGKRPTGVITYDAMDSSDLRDKVKYVLDNYFEIKNKIAKPIIKDSIIEEIKLLINTFS